MKNVLFMLMLLASTSVLAQSTDSTKAKQTNALSKYRQPSQFGVKTDPTPAPTGQPNPAMLKKAEEKRINSSYQYENGRIVGGKTSLQLGKKKN
ncbi:hypothetical protein [Spirosoma sp. KNUC1025]|uniref:hypothetical protein n=1 Tax=Spirosoma sp. KNUC1025 TaxID=2894082 RepID=UPI003870AD0A|nr:hypothetical protein LN737_24875 [Spirosoma sp. KNUC1025]